LLLAGGRFVLSAQDISDTVGGVAFAMKWIRGGGYEMGCTWEQGNDCWRQEVPSHPVVLEDFYLGETEVTRGLWLAVMGELPRDAAAGPACADCPVEGVSWFEARDFVRTLGRITRRKYRLPTEAEWEYAARGGEGSLCYRFAGSHSAEDVAWFGDLYGTARPVGAKRPNELGLYDMSGNVREWCQDRYGIYGRRKAFGPKGPKRGAYRVVRGGCWFFPVQYCRVSYRANLLPEGRSAGTGLRLALSWP
jgi:formylglycine-generating enzyme required for sulfatase activity